MLPYRITVILRRRHSLDIRPGHLGTLHNRVMLLFKRNNNHCLATVVLHHMRHRTTPTNTSLRRIVTNLRIRLLTGTFRFIRLHLLRTIINTTGLNNQVRRNQIRGLFRRFITRIMINDGIFLQALTHITVRPIRNTGREPARSHRPALRYIRRLGIASRSTRRNNRIQKTPMTVSGHFTHAGQAVTNRRTPNYHVGSISLSRRQTTHATGRVPLTLFSSRRLTIFRIHRLPRCTATRR